MIDIFGLGPPPEPARSAVVVHDPRWHDITAELAERIERCIKKPARQREAENLLHLMDLIDYETAEYFRGKQHGGTLCGAGAKAGVQNPAYTGGLVRFIL